MRTQYVVVILLNNTCDTQFDVHFYFSDDDDVITFQHREFVSSMFVYLCNDMQKPPNRNV